MLSLFKQLPAWDSLRWTPIFLLLFGLGAIGAAQGVATPTPLLVVPLALLAVNLLAAIVRNATFRAQPGLLVFHVALLGAVLLAGMGRLTYLKGWVELSQGEAFQGVLMGVEKGEFHQGELERVVFVNEGFVKEYGPNLWTRTTRNQVRWQDDQGVWWPSVIGDDLSLLLRGYRFYTSSNHGFSPVFVWYPADGGEPIKGRVHLPSFPRYRDQSNAWTIPGTELSVVVMLIFDESILNPTQAGLFPVTPKHRLRISTQGESRDLNPGDRFLLPKGGELLYQELGSWMGYRVFYDWTRSWLLATFLVGLLGLSWHFWRKFSLNPVRQE